MMKAELIKWKMFKKCKENLVKKLSEKMALRERKVKKDGWKMYRKDADRWREVCFLILYITCFCWVFSTCLGLGFNGYDWRTDLKAPEESCGEDETGRACPTMTIYLFNDWGTLKIGFFTSTTCCFSTVCCCFYKYIY